EIFKVYQFPTTHGDKLAALLQNSKLPLSDKPTVKAAMKSYKTWRELLMQVDGGFADKLHRLIDLLNAYKLDLELNLIFDSNEDFLYRQKGQLKLDNTIIEEFLPIFMVQVLE